MYRNDLIFDPIAKAAAEEEKFRYHNDLFQPIWEFQSQLDQRFLIQDWIPESAVVILAGEPKSGKTSLATQLALSVANGTPFAGMPTVQSSVLWLALEENGPERRLLLNANALGESSTPLYTCFESLPLSEEATFEALEFWIDRTKAKLIVIDPLQAAIPRDLNKNWTARRYLQTLKSFCHQRRVTALVLHHVKRPARGKARVAESDQLSATASMFIIQTHRPSESTSSDPTVKARLITLASRGRGEFANRTIHLISEGPVDYRLADSLNLSTPTHEQRMHHQAENVIAFLTKCPATMPEICRAVEISPFALRNCITQLRGIGEVTMYRHGSHLCLYALTSLSQAQAIKAYERQKEESEKCNASDPSDISRFKSPNFDPSIDISFSAECATGPTPAETFHVPPAPSTSHHIPPPKRTFQNRGAKQNRPTPG